MKKLISVLLAVFLLCGCAAEKPHATTQAPELTEPSAAPTFAETENPVKFFSVSMGEDYENILRLDAFYNEDGSVHVEYVGDVKKVGTFDANVMHGITEAFLQCGLTALHGQDVYGDGEANASMYVEMEDTTMYAVGFNGEVPQSFKDGYEKLDKFFADLTAELPVYVPQPLVMGEVQEDLLRPVFDILYNSGIQQLDAYTISQVEKGEFFAFTVGLSSEKGIAGAVSCAPLMMTEAYSLVIVKLDGAKAEDICADFEENLDWLKWVCVAPDQAMIAVKDDMVLCLMATQQVFEGTAAGIIKTGWTEVKTLERP